MSVVELCSVCGDVASGRNYNAITCEGCKNFFKRYLKTKPNYECTANEQCIITKGTRNRCQYCRLQKCLAAGMKLHGKRN